MSPTRTSSSWAPARPIWTETGWPSLSASSTRTSKPSRTIRSTTASSAEGARAFRTPRAWGAPQRPAQPRARADEVHDELVRRRVVELGRGPGLLDASVRDDDDLVRQLHRL